MEVKKFRERRLFMQEMQQTYHNLPALLTQPKAPEEKEITRSCQHNHMHKGNLKKACEERIEDMKKFLEQEEKNLEQKASGIWSQVPELSLELLKCLHAVDCCNMIVSFLFSIAAGAKIVQMV